MVSTRSVLAVGLLVLLAGCGGVLGGGDGGSGDGPTTDAPTPTTTSTPTDGDLHPQGVAENGTLTDVSALVTGHDEALADDTYRAALAIDQAQSDGENSSEIRRAQTVLVGADAYRTDLTTVQTGRPTFNATAWSNGSVAVRQATVGGTEQYQRLSPEKFVDQLSGKKTLRGLLVLGDYSVERVTSSGDTTYVNLTADEYNGTPDNGEVTEFSSTLLVDGEGHIHEVDIHLVTEVNGTTATVDFHYELERIGGVTVERPAWVATALDESS